MHNLINGRSNHYKNWKLAFVSMSNGLLFSILISIVLSFIYFGKFIHPMLLLGVLNGTVIASVMFLICQANQKRLRNELVELSLTDDLTQLKNRRGYVFLVEHLLKIAKRNMTGMYLMLTDIDNLKQINDSYGHLEGDRVLQAFARLLEKNYRESDIKARIGGDEFVLMPVGSSEEGIQIIRDRFDRVLNEFNQTHDNPWTISASVGLAYFDPDSPVSADELLRQADRSMYEQKKLKAIV